MACLAPELRFDGYTNAWEQRKLSEFVKYSSSNLTVKDATENGSYDLYDANSIIGRTNSGPMDSDYITIIKDGAGVGRIRKLPKKSMFIGTMGALTPLSSDIDFVYSLLEIFNPGADFSGSTIPHIYFKDYGDNDYFVPKIEEQTKIGKFFNIVDSLIVLHQREHDKLITTKQAMLQKMFPKTGETVPEVRFDGFEDPWVALRIGDIISENSELTADFEQYALCSLMIDDGVVPKPKRYDRSSLITKEESFFKVVPPGCFVSNPMNLRFGAIGFNRMEKPVSVSGYYDVFEIDEGMCSEFWNSYFHTDTLLKIFDDVATGSLIEKRRVQLPTLRDITLLAPSSMHEKQMIAAFFANYNSLVILRAKELDKLKQLKSALLQKMFV